MIVTFSGVYEQVLRFLDQIDNTDTTTLNLVKDCVNHSHQRRLTEYPWPFLLWDSVETFTCTATRLYPLHAEFSRPLSFFNRTKKRFIQEKPVREVTDKEVSTAVTADDSPDHFVLWSRTPVQYQPTSASVLTLVSTSTSDSGATYAIAVKGVNSAGVVVAEIITPTGLTPVVGTTSFTKILAVSKAGAWNGRMTLTSNSGAVTNLTLEATEMGRSYQQLLFLGDPDVGDVIEYRFYRQPLILVNDYDIPEIPSHLAQILVWDSLLMLAAYHTETAPSTIDIWREHQTRMERQLAKTFEDGQALGASPRFVRLLGDDPFYG